ncbi:EF-hand domain-containing protein [Hamadaea tsunoensis]|uniref:EF-hand domain-containing protein n=1 Tax=Hamadaea tsunoensis TaxID=53368 RepID=UPI00041D06AD|nr:EF-hand domain-containing protein [Hamadaea tsunoensis]
MVGELLSRKLRRGFQALDTNEDGTLDVQDFEAAGRRFVDALGIDVQQPEARAVIDGWVQLWRDVIAPMDQDHDNQVSFEEFSSALTQRIGADPDSYNRYLGPLVDATLSTADRARKGWLTPDEFQLLYQTMFRLSDHATRSAFAHLDADSDGRLTLAELRQAIAEFWGTDDESARGNWLFGPL